MIKTKSLVELQNNLSQIMAIIDRFIQRGDGAGFTKEEILSAMEENDRILTSFMHELNIQKRVIASLNDPKFLFLEQRKDSNIDYGRLLDYADIHYYPDDLKDIFARYDAKRNIGDVNLKIIPFNYGSKLHLNDAIGILDTHSLRPLCFYEIIRFIEVFPEYRDKPIIGLEPVLRVSANENYYPRFYKRWVCGEKKEVEKFSLSWVKGRELLLNFNGECIFPGTDYRN